MSLRKIDTLIIDLDNTIFDWFALWHASFEPIHRGVLSASDKSSKVIEAEIRKIHQEHRTSEYTFLIDELDALKNIDKNGDRRHQLRGSFLESQHGRDQNMKLYEGVFTSLWDIKKKGAKIIAYTESMSFYSAYRLKRFGLDGVIDTLYSPEDHMVPHGISLEQLRRLPDEFYQLQVTQTKNTPFAELKPNPKVLLEIINSEGVKIENCVYVGDSLFKDVAMARDVGVLDIHAKYGESQKRPEYELLQRVSHWTEDDVTREAEITRIGIDFEPSVTLRERFSEIFMYCDFQPYLTKGRNSENSRSQFALETWKKTVDVQQHFNDMGMRLRNYAITVVGAFIAAVGFTFQSELQTTILGFTFPTGAFLMLAAFFAWGAFYFIDRFGYHVLLKGAVEHAGKIEHEFNKNVPGIGLGLTISKASQNVKFLCFKTDSNSRLNIFYGIGAVMLIVLISAFFFADTKKVESTKESKGKKTNIERIYQPHYTANHVFTGYHQG